MVGDVRDSLIDRLRNGEKVICPQCKKGYLLPYNAAVDKAHSFSCPKCDFHAHWDPVIEIE